MRIRGDFFLCDSSGNFQTETVDSVSVLIDEKNFVFRSDCDNVHPIQGFQMKKIFGDFFVGRGGMPGDKIENRRGDQIFSIPFRPKIRMRIVLFRMKRFHWISFFKTGGLATVRSNLFQ